LFGEPLTYGALPKASTASSFAGLALICLKNETKADAERDLRDLNLRSRRGCGQRRRVAKGYCATWNLRTKRTRQEFAKYTWSEPERLLPRWKSSNDIADLLQKWFLAVRERTEMIIAQRFSAGWRSGID